MFQLWYCKNAQDIIVAFCEINQRPMYVVIILISNLSLSVEVVVYVYFVHQ